MKSYKIFTLFPSIIKEYVATNAPIKRGIKEGLLNIETVNFRDYAKDKHRKVDDRVYGGGPGLLLKPDVLVDAVESQVNENTKIFLMDPKGKPFTQEIATEMSSYKDVALICGRYEGFDARIKTVLKAESLSLGDFVLTGGELPALSILDACVRLIEGVCDNKLSPLEDSFMDGLLEGDHYTHPFEYRGLKVPEVLLSGHHENIKKWRWQNAFKNTLKHRPDLLKSFSLKKINWNELIPLLKEIYNDTKHRRNY